MSAVGEIVRQAGNGWDGIEIRPIEAATVRVQATVAKTAIAHRGALAMVTLDCYRDLLPDEARAVAAAIVTAASWADQRRAEVAAKLNAAEDQDA